MTQVSNSKSAQLVGNSETSSVAYATDENTKSAVLRTQRSNNPAEELRRKVTAAYTDAQLVEKLGEDFVVLTRAENGNPDIIEFSIDVLGLSTEARPIDRKHIEEDLIPSDESTWEPLEVCFWPEYLPKLDPAILLRIISGNHRVTAAREKDEPVQRLQMKVYKVETEREFRILAIRSNVSHGLNFTEDQRKIQALFLRQQGDSVSAIAAIINVNKSTVSRWLSGNDSNASKKARVDEKKAAALHMLASEEQDLVDEEWSSLPLVTVEAHQLVETRREVVDFLRTPALLDKAHVVAFIRYVSNDELEKESLLSGIDQAQGLLRNVRALLTGE